MNDRINEWITGYLTVLIELYSQSNDSFSYETTNIQYKKI